MPYPFIPQPLESIHMREIPCEVGSELWGVISVCESCQYGLQSDQCKGCNTPRLSYLGKVDHILYTAHGFVLGTASASGIKRISGDAVGVTVYLNQQDAVNALSALTGRTQ